MSRDTSMTLPDGRTLAYTDCGDRKGPVVIYFHGAPTSRLDLVGFEDAFSARGIRVVSPDRPGYGRSSPQPGRSLRDWPPDAAALADHLSVDRFAVMGLSAGGPYAVACAALLPARIGGVAVLNGVTDMGWAPAWEGFDEGDASIMRLGNEEAAAARCKELYGPDGSNFLATVGEMAPSDLAALRDEARARAMLVSIAEAFRQGVAGLAVDLTVQGRPWTFDPGAITAPTTILHGEEDTLAPFAHGRHTAELIPAATFVPFPGHGHLSLIPMIPQLCVELINASKEEAK